MADVLCHLGTDHITDFLWNSWELYLIKECGNTGHFMPVRGLQKLEEACSSGAIKDLFQCLAEERLGIGVLKLHFSIVMIHHRIDQNSVNEREEMWNLFAQELDPIELIEDFKSRGFFREEDKNAKRIGILLRRLVKLIGEDKGFEMLLDHCKRHDYKHILDKEKELYTAEVILITRMKEATGVSDNSNVPGSEYITSVHIQDPKSYFGEDVDVKEIFMKLEPASDTTIAEDVDDANIDQERDMELAHDLDTTRDEAVQMDPDVSEDDKLVGMNFNGDQGEKTDVKDITEHIIAYQQSNLNFMSWFQQQFHNTVSECDQKLDKRILQRLKVLDEALEKRVKRDQEFMDMIEQMSKEGV